MITMMNSISIEKNFQQDLNKIISNKVSALGFKIKHNQKNYYKIIKMMKNSNFIIKILNFQKINKKKLMILYKKAKNIHNLYKNQKTNLTSNLILYKNR